MENKILIEKKTKKGDFLEIKYIGYANGKVFDSNVEVELKKLNPEAQAKNLIICVGKSMIITGFDKALEGKEVGRDYSIELNSEESFGERRRELVKTIPLSVFKEKNTQPQPGMVLAFDNSIARIIAVSGARVLTDFNNPLAGKKIKYEFKILRIVEDEKDKISAILEFFIGFLPEFEIKDKIIVKMPKELENFIKSFSGKFKEFIGKELEFEEKIEEKKE